MLHTNFQINIFESNLNYFNLNIKKHIPNAITSCNLICGCLAIVQIFDGNLITASYLVGLAAIFDFFDGFAARMLKVSSAIGKDLDSLADMVTFGVVPGLLLFKLIAFAATQNNTDNFQSLPISYVAFLIPVFSAIRLAKFNNDNRQSDLFIGLPTPANAILICSLPLILQSNPEINLLNVYLLVPVSILLSYLLIAELPLFALKFKHFKWKDNEIRFIFLGISLLLLLFLKFLALPLIIIFYVLFSLMKNLSSK